MSKSSEKRSKLSFQVDLINGGVPESFVLHEYRFEVEMFPAIWSPAEALVIERHARRVQSLGCGQTLTQGHPRGLPIAGIQLLRSTMEPVLGVLLLRLVLIQGHPRGLANSLMVWWCALVLLDMKGYGLVKSYVGLVSYASSHHGGVRGWRNQFLPADRINPLHAQ